MFGKKKSPTADGKEKAGIKTYFAWITALTTDYLEGIVSAMVKRGYMVGAIDKSGKMISGGLGKPPITAVIGLAVYRRNGQALTVLMVHDDLIYVMDEISAYYYSIVVSGAGEATWIGSNFSLNQPVEEIEVDLSELNNAYDKTLN